MWNFNFEDVTVPTMKETKLFIHDGRKSTLEDYYSFFSSILNYKAKICNTKSHVKSSWYGIERLADLKFLRFSRVVWISSQRTFHILIVICMRKLPTKWMQRLLTEPKPPSNTYFVRRVSVSFPRKMHLTLCAPFKEQLKLGSITIHQKQNRRLNGAIVAVATTKGGNLQEVCWKDHGIVFLMCQRSSAD